jgi:signal peptidase I
MSPGLKLDLADGRRWLIRPVDEVAAAVVAELGKAMRLGPGAGGRELCVAVCTEGVGAASGMGGSGAVVCRIPEPIDRDMQVAQMQVVTSLIACEALVRGGLLLHGALAEYKGSGFIMAGPGTIGKSTASRRLPLPWRSLSDDRTMVVRDGKGRFRAHPWPTWSRFYDNGPGGCWAVEDNVPLRAIFFLGQSPSDRLEPVNATQATALALESAIDLAWETRRTTEESAAQTLYGEGISAARALAAAVPAYSLKLSLGGRFWEEIERVLPADAAEAPVKTTRDEGPMTVVTLAARDMLRVVYTGASMNPTLHEPDLLDVKPYGAARVRPGDVVCFKSPEKDVTVVHRVVAVRRLETGDGGPREGIRTRGDNNGLDDPRVLQAVDIIGRVTAAQRGARRRVIAGGWKGLVVLRRARLGRGIRRSAGLLPHTLYRVLAGLGPFDRLLPWSLRPRLLRFDARCRVFVKLLMGRRTVGQYDDRRGEWRIRRPFRLFVDEKTLPSPEPIVHRP